MQDFQRDFIEFAIETGVLRFGDFELKSGRRSPYFFNAGLFNTGRPLARLGQFYARALQESGVRVDMLFGPAYKGIPLVATTVVGLAEHFGIDMPFAFNRKEAKDHGEGGLIVGSPLQGRVLVVDDVITAGTSVRESADLIRAAGAELAGVLIALDRREKGPSGQSAVREISATYGVPVLSIASLDELVLYLRHEADADAIDPQRLEAMEVYRREYGTDLNGEST